MSIIISPSILSCDFLNIQKEIMALNEIDDIWIHLDIMDGHFVPNLTFGHSIIEKISKITTKKLDVHLMVSNPRFYMKTLSNYNIYNFTFHYETQKNSLDLIMEAKKAYPSVGLSIKPSTPCKVITDKMLKALDLVLIMSVEPGFGGQKFIENSYKKIETIYNLKKLHNKELIIQIDGGINNVTAKKSIENGVTNLVAGSYIFKENSSKEYLNRIKELRK